jgi:uncharacterized protein (TIGR01244 family)
MSRTHAFVAAIGILCAAAAGASAQAPAKETVAGIASFTPIDKNLALGGLITPEGIAELKRRGFKTIINLRKATEANANVEAEGGAVRAAGMKYINVPFAAGDPFEVAGLQADAFIKAIDDRANWPVFAHSVQSHRPTGLLVIKRVLEDGYTLDKAYAAPDTQVLADGSAGSKGMKDFVQKYLQAHGK